MMKMQMMGTRHAKKNGKMMPMVMNTPTAFAKMNRPEQKCHQESRSLVSGSLVSVAAAGDRFPLYQLPSAMTITVDHP